MSTPAAAGRFVGQSVKRKEDPRLLTGHGKYVDDVSVPNMVHAAFVRSQVAAGVITRIDTSAALAVEGVVAVYTGREIMEISGELWANGSGAPSDLNPFPPLRCMAVDDVRFAGDPLAIVLATSRYIAEDAADLVEVDIDSRPAVIDMHAAQAPGAPLVHSERDSNIASLLPGMPDPELDELFANAPHVFSKTFRHARATNVPMECRGILTEIDPWSGEADIRVSSQGPHEFRLYAARVLKMPANAVRVQQQDVGGGFGQKMYGGREEAAAMLAAKLSGRPVKWIEDRRESLMAANSAKDEDIAITMAVDDDGTILGMKAFHTDSCGAYPTGGSGTMAGMMAMVMSGPYKMSKCAVEGATVFTNTCGRGAYRGPWLMETVGREQMVDHVARQLGIDPLEFRLRNTVRSGDLPYTLPSQMVYDIVTPTECLEQAASILGYAEARAMQAAARAAGRYIGIGVSAFVEPSAVGFGPYAHEQATIRIQGSGDVEVLVGSGSHGQSVETTIAQLVAEHLGCKIESVTIRQGDTATSPYGAGTGGSRTAVIVGGAAIASATKLRAKVVEIAAAQLECAPEDLEVADGVVSVRGTPAKAIDFATLATLAYLATDMLPAGMEPGLEATERFKAPMFTWSNAAHMCMVEVDVETGKVAILRYVVSEDCGRMINPMVVEGQISGGVVQGLAGVTLEHMVYDDDGNPLATTFLDYLIPTANDVPDLEIGHVETPANNVGGFKGMGEGGAIGAPPAFANAIADALAPFGADTSRFPLDPSTVLTLIGALD